MILFAVLVIATIVFVVVLKKLEIAAEARRVLRIVTDSSAIVRSKRLSDDEKQEAIQKAAMASFASLLSLVLRTTAALVSATFVVGMGALAQLYAIRDAVDATSDWRGVLVLTLAAIAGWFFSK